MWQLIMGSAYSSEDEADRSFDKRSSAFNREVKLVPPRAASEVGAGGVAAREDGDGMEKPTEATSPPQETGPALVPASVPDPIPPLAPAPDLKELLGVSPVKTSSPELAPIQQRRLDLSPTETKEPLVAERAKVYPRGSFPPSVRKRKEPKFVPYEPYRGAVAFMESGRREQHRAARAASEESEAGLGEEAGAEPGISPELEANYRLMLELKEKEIARLGDKLQQAEKQLKIQAKVNTEVKKLLVASVGEDIEARVDFLTQDKARLAADVVEYNNRIASDWETKEALGVESDVWRSKFLASSVIVEELTRARGAATSRAEELAHLGRLVLGERGQLLLCLDTARATLASLAAKMDPLAPAPPAPAPLDTLAAAKEVEATCRALGARLLGAEHVLAPAPSSPGPGGPDSPAEAELRRALGRGRVGDEGGPASPEVCSQLARDARPHLLRLGDQASSPHQHSQDQFQTCSHCHGSVQNV